MRYSYRVLDVVVFGTVADEESKISIVSVLTDSFYSTEMNDFTLPGWAPVQTTVIYGMESLLRLELLRPYFRGEFSALYPIRHDPGASYARLCETSIATVGGDATNSKVERRVLEWRYQ